jgi:hypothetical protein
MIMVVQVVVDACDNSVSCLIICLLKSPNAKYKIAAKEGNKAHKQGSSYHLVNNNNNNNINDNNTAEWVAGHLYSECAWFECRPVYWLP